MLRRSLSAAAVLFILGGFLFAGTYNGTITKFDKGEITISVKKKGETEGTEKKFKVSKEVKISKKGKTKDDPATEVTVDAFTTALEKAIEKKKGMQAKIETEGEGDKETITKISFGGGGKKKE